MRRRLRVAITLEQCWHRVPGGTATSVLGLAGALAVRSDLEVVGVSALHRRPPPAPFVPPVPVRPLRLPRRVLYETWHAARWPPVERATGDVDVVHATAVAVPSCRAPLVVTIHDLAFLADPTEPTGHGNRFFRRGTDLARRHAALVLCPSQATIDECVAAGFAPDRLRLVPWGVTPAPAAAPDPEPVLTAYGLRRPYVLFVGTIEPRKNLATVVEAFRRLGDRDLDLVLVGPRGWNEDLEALVAPLGPRVRTLGFVPRSDLDALYAGSAAFCYPSRQEGFGLPVLEAMAHGAPVVTSAGTATAEVAGDAGLLVDAADPAAVSAALARVVDEPALADDLRRRGRARAATFTWERSAALTAAAYADAAAERAPSAPLRPHPDLHADASVGRAVPGAGATARVGVNLLWLVPGEVGGSEEYTVRLLAGLAEHPPADLHLTLFVLSSFAAAHPDLVAAYPTVALDLTGRRRSLRVAGEATWLPRAARARQVDLMHHAGGVVPPGGRTASVLTIHDLQPLAVPANFSAAKRWYLRAVLPRSVQAARLVLTPSATAARDVVALLGVDPACVRTVPHGIAPVGEPATTAERTAVRGRYDIGPHHPFFLYPAKTWRHKNHRTLVAALTEVVRTHPEVLLVLTGDRGEAERDLRAQVEQLGLAAHVRRLGRIPRRDLDVLTEEAAALTFPSLFEGFGAPVLEAMARGCPVIAADATALPEVVGPAAVLVDPTDSERWAGVMTELLEYEGRRRSLAAAGRVRAQHFTEARASAALVDAYRAALA